MEPRRRWNPRRTVEPSTAVYPLVSAEPGGRHLASPFILGVRGMAAAARLGIPTVAVHQADLAGYARTYVHTGETAAWRRNEPSTPPMTSPSRTLSSVS